MGLIKVLPENSRQNFSKSILLKDDPLVELKQILYNEAECLKTTFTTGFIHNDKPVVDVAPPIFNLKPPIKENEDSVMDSVDTGFGSNNTILLDCPKPEFKTHLFKENYLGEFKSETEKALVRNNLEVYSKKETNLIVSHIITENNLVSKEEIKEMIEDLDFVDSITRANALYDIPNNLFKI